MAIQVQYIITRELVIPAGGSASVDLLTLPSDAYSGLLEYITYEIKPSTSQIQVELRDRGIRITGLHLDLQGKFSTPVTWIRSIPLRQNAKLQAVGFNSGATNVTLTIGISGYWEI